MTIGQTKVPSGVYYLGLHKTAKAQWQLMLLDPKEVRKKKAHPGMTANLTAKLNVDLIYRKVDKSTDKLTITIKPFFLLSASTALGLPKSASTCARR